MRESDIAEAKRSIKNFNAKITRVSKKDPANAGLYPEKISYSDFIKGVETRKDFNKALKSLQGFTTRGAENIVNINDDVKTTAWHVENVKRETRTHNISVSMHNKKSSVKLPKISVKDVLKTATPETVKTLDKEVKKYLNTSKTIVKSNRGAVATASEIEHFYKMQEAINKERAERKQKLLEKPVKRGGVDTGFKRGEMGRLKENELNPSNKKFENMSQQEWEKSRKYFDSLLDKQSRSELNERMRENYIKGLKESNFITDEDGELEKYIRGIDFDTFYETHETDETGTFLFYKDPLEFEVRKAEIIATWKEAYESYNKN